MSEPKEFKVRDCADYLEEYTSCTSLSNRIQTYYAFGHYQKKEDCLHWKEMWNLCDKCTKGSDNEAKAELQRREKEKADELIRKRSSVWTYRDEPPAMWYFPGKLQKDLNGSK